MNENYEQFRQKAFSAFRGLAKESAAFEDAEMLLGAAETSVSLKRSRLVKNIDTEWISVIEETIPALDILIRNPSVAIEDVDEILPVELSRHITEKSIKHLAQHTNLILDIKDDEVTPSKILNVFHEETHLTYENKFVNTLLSRLSAFVDKRFRALKGGSGVEHSYKFDYDTEFEHLAFDSSSRNTARINLRIELTSPLGREISESDKELNDRYATAFERIKRINMALTAYRSSAFAERLGKNYIRPPVIRTNAILKNKNLKECLNLWEYIENYDKVGYSGISDKYIEMPSSDFIGGLYSSAALQYVSFYSGVIEDWTNNRLLSEKHLFETMPEFDEDEEDEELMDYSVYDSEYRKTVPVSRLMNNRKKLSEDEKSIRNAIVVALMADELIWAEQLEKEANERRLAREKKEMEEAERRRKEEEERRRREEEEATRLAKEEAERLAKEEAERIAREEAERLSKEEAERLAKEQAAIEEALAQMTSEEKLDEFIEGYVAPSEDGITGFGNVRGEETDFVFSDGKVTENAVVVPYTRAEYLALPRKKKKSVLMNVKKLVRYKNTCRLIDVLRQTGSDNPRILERIERLEERRTEEGRFLPSTKLWEESVKRLRK